MALLDLRGGKEARGGEDRLLGVEKLEGSVLNRPPTERSSAQVLFVARWVGGSVGWLLPGHLVTLFQRVFVYYILRVVQRS